MVAAGYYFRQQLIWVKPQMVLSRQAYHWRHETCWYAVRKGAGANWKGDRKQTTIWEMDSPISSSTANSDKDDASTLHPTQKPVEGYQKAIINHTVKGDLTCDPFLGSGTAVVAAESLGRVCYACELDPRFIAVSLQRLEDMGLKPVLSK
jgi:DNA modification methylase